MPLLFESAREAVGAVFCPGKDEHGVELRIGQQVQQQRRLEVRRTS